MDAMGYFIDGKQKFGLAILGLRSRHFVRAASAVCHLDFFLGCRVGVWDGWSRGWLGEDILDIFGIWVARDEGYFPILKEELLGTQESSESEGSKKKKMMTKCWEVSWKLGFAEKTF